MHTDLQHPLRCSMSCACLHEPSSQLTTSLPFLLPSLSSGCRLPLSLQASLHQRSAAREQVRASREAHGSTQVPAMAGKVRTLSQEEPDVCTLSLAEKMALFNRLAQPPSRVTHTRGDSRHRRSNTRYQTQPITLGDIEQVGESSF